MSLVLILLLMLVLSVNLPKSMYLPRRLSDIFGDGHLGASRGNRPHLGVDFVTVPGTPIYAPFDFKSDGISFPYVGNLVLTGYKGKSVEGYHIRLWYITPLPSLLVGSVDVSKGDLIGYAQSLQDKYPGITNHIHVQVWSNTYVPNSFEYQGKYYIDYV